MKTNKVPERMCIACRQLKPKSELIRIVTGDFPQVDVSGKVSGRGVYICKCRQCIDKAKKIKSFAKNYGFSLDTVCEELEKLIEQ